MKPPAPAGDQGYTPHLQPEPVCIADKRQWHWHHTEFGKLCTGPFFGSDLGLASGSETGKPVVLCCCRHTATPRVVEHTVVPSHTTATSPLPTGQPQASRTMRSRVPRQPLLGLARSSWRNTRSTSAASQMSLSSTVFDGAATTVTRSDRSDTVGWSRRRAPG